LTTEGEGEGRCRHASHRLIIEVNAWWENPKNGDFYLLAQSAAEEEGGRKRTSKLQNFRLIHRQSTEVKRGEKGITARPFFIGADFYPPQSRGEEGRKRRY